MPQTISKKSKAKHPKMDPYLINTDEPYEIEWVYLKYKKKGKIFSKDKIKKVALACNNGRRATYLELDKLMR